VVPWLAATAAYTALTTLLLWPVVSHLASAFPHDRIDPALNAAILAWDARALPMTQAWWDAPIFWPSHGALALSEHLLGISVLTTPLQWGGLSPLTAYNIAWLISFPLTALSAHALVFACVKRHDAALLGGCIFGFNPYRMAQLAHVQMLWAFGMPLALMALHQFVERRDRRWLVLFGLAWLAQAAFNGYYMLFLPILLAGWTLWFAREPYRVGAIAATWIVATLPLAPLLMVYARFHAASGLSRTIIEIERFSADLLSLFAASPLMIAWHRLSHGQTSLERDLFPGLLAAVLAVVAAGVALARRREPGAPDSRAWRIANRTALALSALFLAAAASVLVLGPWKWTIGSVSVASIGAVDKPLSLAAAFLALAIVSGRTFRSAWQRRSVFAFYLVGAMVMLTLSFGPRPAIAGVHYFYRAPYYWLLQLPGFSELRVPARFAMLFVLCLATAAAIGFDRLTAALSPRTRRMLAAAAVVIVLIESWPRVPLAIPAEPIAALTAVGGKAPVLELPAGITERDADAVYRSLSHGHPVINGYSGYSPLHYDVLNAALQAGDRGVIGALARDQEIIVALDRQTEFPRWFEVVGLRPVIADAGGYRIYRVPKGPGPPPPFGPALHVQSITADLRGDAVALMQDGDLRTAWSTGRPQTGGETLVIDLGQAADLSAVRLSLGPFTMSFPRGLSVECSADRERWSSCWSGSAAALAVRAMLDDPTAGPLTIRLSAQGVRYVLLRQTASETKVDWAVAELAVFGK
jgi:hypothetical protein